MALSAMLIKALAILVFQLVVISAGVAVPLEGNTIEPFNNSLALRPALSLPSEDLPPMDETYPPASPPYFDNNITFPIGRFVARSELNRKKNKLVFPEKGNYRSTQITEGPSTDAFPLGMAPLSQQPCEVRFAVSIGWYEGHFLVPKWMRRRIVFNVPRTDMPRDVIEKAAAGLWHWGIHYDPDEARGPARCNTAHSHNVQIWPEADGSRWFIDFDQTTLAVYKGRSKCLVAWFIQSYGQWTGCRYNESLSGYLMKDSGGKCESRNMNPMGYEEPPENPCHFKVP